MISTAAEASTAPDHSHTCLSRLEVEVEDTIQMAGLYLLRHDDGDGHPEQSAQVRSVHINTFDLQMEM